MQQGSDFSPKSELEDGQQTGASERGGGQSKRHGSELPVGVIEGEGKIGSYGWMKGKGEEAVGEVEFSIPAVGCGVLDCFLYGGVGEVDVLEVLVEVAGKVDDQPWLLARFDDDVQRLNPIRTGVVGW